MKFLLGLFIILGIFFVQIGQVLAYNIPQFTSCINPQGQVKASYDNGTHGIAGKTASFEGKDTVYKLSGDALTQCFCSVNGSGIQTNWWKASSLTEQEINLLKSQGWIYIPNGALWGLDNDSYLAFNSEFSCPASSNRPSGFSPTTDIPGPGGGNGQGGSVLGLSTGSVLGLASTGNIKFLYFVFLISVLLVLTGVSLKNRARKLSK